MPHNNGERPRKKKIRVSVATRGTCKAHVIKFVAKQSSPARSVSRADQDHARDVNMTRGGGDARSNYMALFLHAYEEHAI